MEKLLERQQYELAFHLLPSFTETELDGKRREIEELISKSGGIVSRYGEIKKMRLAYLIKREHFSNFGYIEFFAPKNAIEKINKDLTHNESVIRHLLMKKEEERIAKPKLTKPKIEKPKEEPSFTEKAEGKETEELDKKIEEILEKL